MNRIQNNLPALPRSGDGNKELARAQPQRIGPLRRPDATNTSPPPPLRGVSDIAQGMPTGAAASQSGDSGASLETRLLRALLPEGGSSQLLRPQNVRQGLDDLKTDWAQLIDDPDDPLLQVAELALRHCDSEIRDLQRTLQLMIAP